MRLAGALPGVLVPGRCSERGPGTPMGVSLVRGGPSGADCAHECSPPLLPLWGLRVGGRGSVPPRLGHHPRLWASPRRAGGPAVAGPLVTRGGGRPRGPCARRCCGVPAPCLVPPSGSLMRTLVPGPRAWRGTKRWANGPGGRGPPCTFGGYGPWALWGLPASGGMVNDEVITVNVLRGAVP